MTFRRTGTLTHLGARCALKKINRKREILAQRDLDTDVVLTEKQPGHDTEDTAHRDLDP
jgi:hypothetical protein